jgi:hypothetical protein
MAYSGIERKTMKLSNGDKMLMQAIANSLERKTMKTEPLAMGIAYDAGFKYYLYVRFLSPVIGGKPGHKLYKFATVADRENAIDLLGKDGNVDFHVSLESEPF